MQIILLCTFECHKGVKGIDCLPNIIHIRMRLVIPRMRLADKRCNYPTEILRGQEV